MLSALASAEGFKCRGHGCLCHSGDASCAPPLLPSVAADTHTQGFPFPYHVIKGPRSPAVDHAGMELMRSLRDDINNPLLLHLPNKDHIQIVKTRLQLMSEQRLQRLREHRERMKWISQLNGDQMGSQEPSMSELPLEVIEQVLSCKPPILSEAIGRLTSFHLSDITDQSQLFRVVRVSRAFYIAGRALLYRSPRFAGTFSYALFCMSVNAEPEGPSIGSNVEVLDLSSWSVCGAIDANSKVMVRAMPYLTSDSRIEFVLQEVDASGRVIPVWELRGQNQDVLDGGVDEWTVQNCMCGSGFKSERSQRVNLAVGMFVEKMCNIARMQGIEWPSVNSCLDWHFESMQHAFSPLKFRVLGRRYRDAEEFGFYTAVNSPAPPGFGNQGVHVAPWDLQHLHPAGIPPWVMNLVNTDPNTPANQAPALQVPPPPPHQNSPPSGPATRQRTQLRAGPRLGPRVEVTASSLLSLSKRCRSLRHVSLAFSTITPDVKNARTGEWRSAVFPSKGVEEDAYAGMEIVLAHDALLSLVHHCEGLISLDLRGCDWIKTDHVLKVVLTARSLRFLNLIRCEALPAVAQKLFHVEHAHEMEALVRNGLTK